MPREHKRLAASAAYRWIACPGSIALAEKYGLKSKSSVYAQEGIDAHALAEKCLRSKKNADAFLGQKVKGFLVTPNMAEAVQVYLDYVRGIPGDARVEQQVEVCDGVTGGTADFVSYADECLFIVDYKHGEGIVVSPEQNPQLMIYALGALAEYPDAKVVKASIVQPRARGATVKEWETNRGDLEQWRQEVLQPAIAAVEEGTEFHVGGHCRFCPAAAVCEDRIREACEVAKTEFGVVPAIKPECLPPERIAKVLLFAETLTPWVKAVRVYARECAEAGYKIPGYKLVKGYPQRSWDEDAEDKVAEVLGEQAYEKKLLTPAKAEKVLSRLGLDKNTLSEFVVRTPGKLTLVPQSDKRKEVIVDAASEFVESLEMFE